MGRRLTNPHWWQRLRHRKGYGIHSPFAFRFITEVLNPPHGYRYYAEDSCTSADARVLARLRGFFSPDSVSYTGRRAEALRAKDEPSAAISDADMIVADLSEGCPSELMSRVARGNVVVLAFHHSHGRTAPLLKSMNAGMSFRNASSRIVIVARSKLPRQDFWVWW